jgi:hypothetical protein
MRNESVFRVGYFVQMVSAVQIKFRSTVARLLHPSRPYPELEQDLHRPAAYWPLTVLAIAGFTHCNKLGKRDGRRI